MQKKIRSNREYEDIFELASHLNYYFQRNPDAELTMNDLKKIVDRNPKFCLEEQKITNGFGRALISDDDGHVLQLVMSPRFYVFDEEYDDGDPEDETMPDEDVYEEESESSEEETEESSEEETAEDADPWAVKFADLNEHDEIYWRNNETGKVHKARVIYIHDTDDKVQSEATEITIDAEGIDHYITIFPEEIVDEDDFDDDDLFDPDTDKVEDAEIVDGDED